MRAARFLSEDEPLAVEDVSPPAVGPNDARVEVAAASICGSDSNYLKGKRKPATVPLTLGHEGAGTVVETGSAVDPNHLDPGDRVVLHYPRFCGYCEPCLHGDDNRCENRSTIGHSADGTFAEQLVVPARNLLHLPESVPFELGSALGCAVPTGYHAVRTGEIDWGDTVAVFGVGGVGLHAIKWAAFAGAGTIVAIDIDPAKLGAATDYGATATVDATGDVAGRLAAITDDRGVDVAIECSGAPVALEQAIAAVDGANPHDSGTVVSVGVQTEPFQGEWQGLREGSIRVSSNHSRGELRSVIDLVAEGVVDLDRSVSRTVALDDIREGFDETMNGDDPGRVVVIP